MKKSIVQPALSLLTLFTPYAAYAAVDFKPIVPLPNLTPQAYSSLDFAGYVQLLFRYSITIGAMLAVLMFVYGGFQYMTSEATGGKKNGLDHIRDAVVGLLLLISVVVILQVINPCILNITTFTAGNDACAGGHSAPATNNSQTQAPTQAQLDAQTAARLDQATRQAQLASQEISAGSCWVSSQNAPCGPIRVCKLDATHYDNELTADNQTTGRCTQGQPAYLCNMNCPTSRVTTDISGLPNQFISLGACTTPDNATHSTGHYCCKDSSRRECFVQNDASACPSDYPTAVATCSHN